MSAIWCADQYFYVRNDYRGGLPANRKMVEAYERGVIYRVPVSTTMHLDLARQLRIDLDGARADARWQGAGNLVENFE